MARRVEGRSLANVLPLLPKLASVIRTCMRDSDFVARYGDDEFVVVMPQTTLAGARVFGDRVRKRRGRGTVGVGLLRPHGSASRRRCPRASGPCRLGAVQRESGRAESVVRPHRQPHSRRSDAIGAVGATACDSSVADDSAKLRRS